MSPPRWDVTTDEARERFASASDRGGQCAVCGKMLAADEPVYIMRVRIQRKPLSAPGTRWDERSVPRDAPLGRECVAPVLLAHLEGQEPDPCVGCGRLVYYEFDRAGRQQSSCSKRCAKRRGES